MAFEMSTYFYVFTWIGIWGPSFPSKPLSDGGSGVGFWCPDTAMQTNLWSVGLSRLYPSQKGGSAYSLGVFKGWGDIPKWKSPQTTKRESPGETRKRDFGKSQQGLTNAGLINAPKRG